MQGIYTYIPEKKHVCKEYNVAAILSLLFMAPISLVPALVLMCFYISILRSMFAVPNIIIIIIIIIILNNTDCRICGSESYNVKNSSPLGYGNIWIDVSVVKV
jgi:hypothetical protein